MSGVKIQQNILIIAEHDNKILKSSTLHAIAAAKKLPGEIHLYIAGFECEPVVEMAKRITELSKIMVADSVCYAHGLAENVAQNIAYIAHSYRYVLTAASIYGKNILPRVAALLDVSQISEITKILSENRFVRPIYAGNALAEVQTVDPIIVISIRSTAFPAVMIGSHPLNTPIEYMENLQDLGCSRFIQQVSNVSERPELTSARIVVSGGRGLQSKENFNLIEALADKLGAAVGASRAAVDAGYVSNDCQIGQTGKVVAPELYIAVGISGAIQHLAGMKESKVIVAINHDRSAPIFQIADYGLVGDLFEILPELSRQLAVPKCNNRIK